MSEQRKERWQYQGQWIQQMDGDQIEIDAGTESRAKRIVQAYNACISLPNPEADVKALVEALEAVHARRIAWPKEVEEKVVNALVRMRKEP